MQIVLWSELAGFDQIGLGYVMSLVDKAANCETF